MKKFFLFAAAAIAALTVSAQTLDFPEIIATADFGATRTFEKDGISLVISNGNNKFAVDANTQRFGNAQAYAKDTMRLKTGGASGSKSSMVLNVPADGKVTVHARSASGTVARTLTFSQNGLDILNANLNDADAIEVEETKADQTKENVKVFPVFTCNVKAGAIDLSYGEVGTGSTETDESKIKAGGINIYAIIFESAQGFENADAAVKAEKFFRNGQLIIRKNGVEYNALGAQL